MLFAESWLDHAKCLIWFDNPNPRVFTGVCGSMLTLYLVVVSTKHNLQRRPMWMSLVLQVFINQIIRHMEILIWLDHKKSYYYAFWGWDDCATLCSTSVPCDTSPPPVFWDEAQQQALNDKPCCFVNTTRPLACHHTHQPVSVCSCCTGTLEQDCQTVNARRLPQHQSMIISRSVVPSLFSTF